MTEEIDGDEFYTLSDKAKVQLQDWEDRLSSGAITDEELIEEAKKEFECETATEAVQQLATLVAIAELGGTATVNQVTALLTGLAEEAEAG